MCTRFPPAETVVSMKIPDNATSAPMASKTVASPFHTVPLVQILRDRHPVRRGGAIPAVAWSVACVRLKTRSMRNCLSVVLQAGACFNLAAWPRGEQLTKRDPYGSSLRLSDFVSEVNHELLLISVECAAPGLARLHDGFEIAEVFLEI